MEVDVAASVDIDEKEHVEEVGSEKLSMGHQSPLPKPTPPSQPK